MPRPRRIRQLRERIFSQHVLHETSPDPTTLETLLSLDRYEERATARRKKALQRLAYLRNCQCSAMQARSHIKLR